MITVADIVALPAFKQVRLAAPCSGTFGRAVVNVGIMDCMPDASRYGDYLPGEFIVSNLGFVRDDASRCEEALLAMLARGVAAVAIKTVYAPPISDRVLAESTSQGVPLFLYEGDYHEVLAYQALDLIRRDREESDNGGKLDALLAEQDGASRRAALYDIAALTGSTVQCFAVAPRGADECSLYAALDVLGATLSDFRRDWGSVVGIHACRYHADLLAFVSYAQPPAHLRSQSESDLLVRVTSAAPVFCGVGEEVPLGDGDLAIRQALAALDEARTRRVASVHWVDLHERAFCRAAAQDRLFARTCSLYRSMLTAYDEANDAELAATAEAFAVASGDVRVAAELLNQHPNTVRYRLRKVKDVLGMPDAADRELARFLALVTLCP